jgi:tryptophan synthase alpha chain
LLETGRERTQRCFASNKANGRGGLLPYLTAGFPDAATTMDLIRTIDRSGVTAIEIGFPYSDSIADGPIIQSSFHYVLERGQRVNDVFDMVRAVRHDVWHVE